MLPDLPPDLPSRSAPPDVEVPIRAGGWRLVLEFATSLLLGAGIGLVSSFQALHTVHGLWVGVLATTVAAVALGVALAEAWSSVSAPLVAMVGWLLCVGYFAAGRPEGDVVVPGSVQGYSFLFLGLLGFAPGVRIGLSRQQRAASPERLSGR